MKIRVRVHALGLKFFEAQKTQVLIEYKDREPMLWVLNWFRSKMLQTTLEETVLSVLNFLSWKVLDVA